MDDRYSTFDRLVQTLSSSEAKALLANVQNSVARFSAEVDAETEASKRKKSPPKIRKFTDEPVVFRLLLKILAFFKSLPVEVIYERELLKRLGRSLQQTSRHFINTKQHLLTKGFYDELSSLHKTQLFFSSLLSAYDSDKGIFYLILSSYVAPGVYKKLIQDTDPFGHPSIKNDAEQSRTSFLRRIDDDFSGLRDDEKTLMYDVARSIEWMKAFSDIPFEKFLLKFSVSSQGTGITCSLDLVQEELAHIATLLLSKKHIPDVLLQALFVLSTEEQLKTETFDLHAQSTTFIDQATQALSAIGRFSGMIPILDFVRFATQNIHWTFHHVDSGEDWFLLFKSAWRKRFNEKWGNWSLLRRTDDLKKRMCAVLESDTLLTFEHRPWKNLWLPLSLKRRLSIDFLITFFNTFYDAKLVPPLKTLLLDGDFYRRENRHEFTQTFNALHRQKRDLIALQQRLAPDGDLAAQFVNLQRDHVGTLSGKNQLNTLIQGLDAQIHEFIELTISAFKSIESILVGIIGGGRASIYATLINWGNIQGSQNSAFRMSIEGLQKTLHTTLSLLADAASLETDPTNL